MLKLVELIERDAEELAQIETMDNGKGIYIIIIDHIYNLDYIYLFLCLFL